MAIVYDTLMKLDIPAVEQSYDERDAMLYALSLGLGLDPADEDQLRFVYEKGLKVLPTLPVVLADPGAWISWPETGVDYLKVVHGEHALELHVTPAATGKVIGKTRIADIIDKGPGKGALVLSEMTQVDATSGALLATIRKSTFARGDGGFGGPSRPAEPAEPLPERPPEHVCDLPTSPQAALLYRLNADRNPLHADPATARRAGFERPILHGLATFGIAGYGLLKSCCGGDPERFGRMSVRFTAPVYPGETIRMEIWQYAQGARFRARVLERDVIALGNGRFDYRPETKRIPAV